LANILTYWRTMQCGKCLVDMYGPRGLSDTPMSSPQSHLGVDNNFDHLDLSHSLPPQFLVKFCTFFFFRMAGMDVSLSNRHEFA
jgi:hypothetical protein